MFTTHENTLNITLTCIDKLIIIILPIIILIKNNIFKMETFTQTQYNKHLKCSMHPWQSYLQHIQNFNQMLLKPMGVLWMPLNFKQEGTHLV